jgi:UDP-glucose 6-dehydrogenase
MSITVYGHTGMVGSQLYRWLVEHDTPVTGISLDRQDGEPSTDWAFLCLPTLNVETGPYLYQNQNAIWEVAIQTPARFIVVRSTVLPGTCRELQRELPDKTIYHWPEFLSERTAYADFCSPKLRVVGGPREPWERDIEPVLPPAPVAYVELETSEVIKYAHNTHGAMQVIYANMLYDVCSTSGASWETVRCLLPSLGYIAPETSRAYWNVWQDGKRGYAGHCFPKDVDALRSYIKHDLLDGIAKANARLRK